jgi:hypothetical protein
LFADKAGLDHLYALLAYYAMIAGTEKYIFYIPPAHIAILADTLGIYNVLFLLAFLL